MNIACFACVAHAVAGDECCGATGRQDHSNQPARPISFGTATPGGGFPLYGNAFAEIMNAADPTLSIEPRNTKGSNENIPLLEEGQARYRDWSRASRPTRPSWASGGRATAPENPDRDVFQSRHVRGARRQPLQDHSRSRRPADRVRRQGLRPADPVALYARWSRPEAGRGFSNRSISTMPATARRWCSTDGSRRLWGAGIGWPGFTAIATSPGGARFIAPDADEIARIRAKHTFLKPLTVPAGSYPNQNAPINSVGSWSFILVRDSLPDDVAYHLARDAARRRSARSAGNSRRPAKPPPRTRWPRRQSPESDPSRRAAIFPRDRGGEVAMVAKPVIVVHHWS